MYFENGTGKGVRVGDCSWKKKLSEKEVKQVMNHIQSAANASNAPSDRAKMPSVEVRRMALAMSS